MRDCPDFHLSLAAFYQGKRDLFCTMLQSSRFRLRPSAGTFFQLADYSAISEESDKDFATRMTQQHGVAVIPVSVFYAHPPDQRVIRFCFAKSDETLRQAAEHLCKL